MMFIKEIFGRSPGIFMKFTIAFVVVGLIPLMTLSYISLTTLSNQVERHTVDSYEEMLSYSSNRIQNLHDEYNNISKLMYRYNLPALGTINDLIDKEDKLENYRREQAIDDFLRTILNTDKYIDNVFFIPSHDNKVRFHDRKSKRFIAANFTLYDDYNLEIMEVINDLTLLPVHIDDYFHGSNEYVLTFVRNLLQTETLVSVNSEVLGTLLIDVNIKSLEDIFLDLELKPEDEVYVISEDGYSIYSNQENKIARKLVLDEESLSDEYMQLEQDVEGLGWKVIARIEKQSILDNLAQTRITIQTVLIISIIALLIFSIMFSRQFSQPIYKMTKLMKQVESGNMDLKMNIDRNDEIGLLANGFDRMVSNLNSYIKKVYVAEIGQKQAQLDALRSQINPHYLYNTLEVIRMTAVQNEDYKAADMIHYLSLQLKYVMKQNENYVPLRREVDHVRSYLKLIQVRYEDKVNYEITMDEKLAEYPIPKLSIQPLVENAVIHGLKPKLKKGKIMIRCEIESDQKLSVTVIDDGVGIKEGELISLQNSINSQDKIETEEGIGLRNVHNRIRELYGHPFGLELTSRPHIGTMIKLTVPLGENKYV